jgi:hypothetical protein
MSSHSRAVRHTAAETSGAQNIRPPDPLISRCKRVALQPRDMNRAQAPHVPAHSPTNPQITCISPWAAAGVRRSPKRRPCLWLGTPGNLRKPRYADRGAAGSAEFTPLSPRFATGSVAWTGAPCCNRHRRLQPAPPLQSITAAERTMQYLVLLSVIGLPIVLAGPYLIWAVVMAGELRRLDRSAAPGGHQHTAAPPRGDRAPQPDPPSLPADPPADRPFRCGGHSVAWSSSSPRRDGGRATRRPPGGPRKRRRSPTAAKYTGADRRRR